MKWSSSATHTSATWDHSASSSDHMLRNIGCGTIRGHKKATTSMASWKKVVVSSQVVQSRCPSQVCGARHGAASMSRIRTMMDWLWGASVP
ncbi:hypothetical protein E2C01_008201 [Portunus trituberculatus]|uniref:Uncharacterized protein n=1 Tax=Portunus trituberculatus TaxID=210409 RepID=A0A5B7D2H4_PORTR|nr:hypothetical protein [Portunus trituberculatus]